MGLAGGGAGRVVVYGAEIVAPLGVFNVDDAVSGVQHAVATVAAGEDAIKHINAAGYAFQQVGWGAYAHQVAGFFLGKYVAAELGDAVHIGDGFAYAQATDGVAGLVLASDELAGFYAQVVETAALDYGKERLTVAVFRLGVVHVRHAALEPTVGQVHALFGVVAGAGVGGALVEGHNDVGADIALDA